MVLAGFGLGSFTFSIWMARYRWVFLAATFVFLGFAHWRNWQNRGKTGPWTRGILYGTTVLSLGLVVYSLIAH